MELKKMGYWDEEMEFELKLSCSPTKRKRRYSCSLDLFNGSSCETIAGNTQSLNSSNNSSYASADPRGPLKEQDLIRCLMETCSSSEENNSVSFSSGVDCTLSLGTPHSILCAEEQYPMEMLKQRTMENNYAYRRFNVFEIMKSKVLSSKITNSNLEASYNMVAPFAELSNRSSVNNNVYRPQLYKSCCSSARNATSSSNPTSWFPINHIRSNFMDSKEILALRNYATVLGSKLPTRPKKTSNNSIYMNNHIGSNTRLVQQKQRKNITSDDSVRRCSTCDTTTTPLWRNGPKGVKSLCNACGIRYKKEERRVASARAAAADNNNHFLKASCSSSFIDPNNNKTSATQQFKPSKKLKLQPIGPEKFSLLAATS